ncbi:MAG TPA: benzoate-CoA ligase family protein [Kofleriaceae bacterium]|nr:benzoate-CoA ligase family protein [Kofleriaceae bacterium]
MSTPVLSQVEGPVFPESFNLADYWLFDRLAEGRGEHPALRYGDRVWSYAEVAERTRALARYFVDAGVAREQRVYSILPDTPPFAWTNFATLASGAVVAMGNPAAPAADLGYVVEYTRAAVVVTLPAVAASLEPAFDACPELCVVLLVPDTATGDDPEAPIEVPAALRDKPYAVLSLTDAIARGASSAAALPRTHRDDVCVWLFTSGSTGRPKAAMHTHRDFAFNTEVYAKRTVGYRAGDITVSVPRLFFGYATGTNLWFPFAVGATVGLFSERPTPEALAAAIEHYRPTVVTNVPTMLGKLLDFDDTRAAAGEPRLDLSCVRFHLSAGEALPPALLERFTARWNTDVYDGIGSAEMFHIYCSNRPGDIVPGSLGRAVEGYELRVLPQDADGPGAPAVAPGEIGVLWVKGDSVALGYAQDRAKSWQTFHGHWCRTGDLFTVDERGYLWFSGRADDLFKSGGIWVAPLEVEECLTAHDAVTLAAVIPAKEAGLDKPKAFVMVSEGHRARVRDAAGRADLRAELQEHVKARLTRHKYPRWVVFVDDLPKNDRGKVDKKILKEREAAGENPSE